MKRLLRILSALVVGAVATLAFAAPAEATTATFVKTAVWSTGYTAQVTVTNNYSVPLTGWEVAFLLPATSTISAAWSVQPATTTPYYSMVNAAWNGILNPGDTATFGFTVTGTDDPVFLWPL